MLWRLRPAASDTVPSVFTFVDQFFQGIKPEIDALRASVGDLNAAQPKTRLAPIPPTVTADVSRILAAFENLTPPGIFAILQSQRDRLQQRALAALREVPNDYPLGTVHFVRGLLLYNKAWKTKNRWEDPDLALSEEVFRLAADTASQASIRQQSLVQAVTVEAFLNHPALPKANPQMHARLAPNLKRLIQGELTLQQCAVLANASLDARRPDLSRVFLTEWMLKSPGNLGAYTSWLRIEELLGNHVACLTLVDQVLKQLPKDASGHKQRTEFEKRRAAILERIRAVAKQ